VELDPEVELDFEPGLDFFWFYNLVYRQQETSQRQKRKRNPSLENEFTYLVQVEGSCSGTRLSKSGWREVSLKGVKHVDGLKDAILTASPPRPHTTTKILQMQWSSILRWSSVQFLSKFLPRSLGSPDVKGVLGNKLLYPNSTIPGTTLLLVYEWLVPTRLSFAQPA